MRVIVVGGGVIGLCCAREIARQGGEVTLVERDRCGGATSLRNAGQIVPSLCAPLAVPGVIKQSAGWLLKPGSPLRIRPRLDPELFLWLLQFARNASESTYRRCLQTAVAFGYDTPHLFDQLREDGVDFEMYEEGLLFATLSERALEHDAEMYSDLEAAGYEGEYKVLDADEARAFEPSLSADVAGGLFVGGERHVRPESLMKGLREDLRARGATVVEEAEVYGLSQENGGSWRVLSSEGAIDGDRVLVTAGVWTKELLGDLGVRIPLEAGKGYSITARGHGTAPRRPLKLAEAQVVVTPYDEGVRVSGMFDLGAANTARVQRRINDITRSAAPYLHDWEPEEPRLEWAGLRPATPDTLPIIDMVPSYRNLYVATGHCMLGVTLGPATARATAPLVLEDRRTEELEPFRANRF